MEDGQPSPPQEAAPEAPQESSPAGEAQVAKPSDPLTIGHVTRWIREPFKEDEFGKALEEHLAALAAKHGVDAYQVIYLLDGQDELGSWHSNRIYRAASPMPAKKPILLVLHNLGGSIEAGYLISKTCKGLSSGKFVVAVPRKAKSAATLLSLGADEVHMGLMSELGPIDPQFGGLPALGMKNALEILSDLACKYPGASTMLAEYIKDKLDLRILGYFERINESAMQYAERLLAGRILPEGVTPKSLADHLVNHYKDHGFVIDHDESRKLLGADVVKSDTSEYAFSNAVYEAFDFLRFVLDLVLNKDVDLVGRGSGAVRVFDRKKNA